MKQSSSIVLNACFCGKFLYKVNVQPKVLVVLVWILKAASKRLLGHGNGTHLTELIRKLVTLVSWVFYLTEKFYFPIWSRFTTRISNNKRAWDFRDNMEWAQSCEKLSRRSVCFCVYKAQTPDRRTNQNLSMLAIIK